MSRVSILTILLIGCGASGLPGVKGIKPPPLKDIAKVAGPALREMAKNKGIEIDEAGTACFPISELMERALDIEIPGATILCYAPPKL